MAEQRIDATLVGGTPVYTYGSFPRPNDDRIGTTWTPAGGITRYRMRGWSASLGQEVEWTAPNVDSLGGQAPSTAGTLTDIVWAGFV